MFACLHLIVWCLSACVQRVSCEALNQAHNDSIHCWLCVIQQLHLLIPHVGFLFNLCCSVQPFNYHCGDGKGRRWETPQEIENILSSRGGQVETDRKAVKNREAQRNQAGANPLNFFRTSLKTNREKETQPHGRQNGYLLSDECSRPVRKAPWQLWPKSERPPTSFLVPPFSDHSSFFYSFSLFLRLVQQTGERRRECRAAGERG